MGGARVTKATQAAVRVAACALAALAPAAQVQAQPVGTAFTYQGRLNDAGAPANGAFDLQLVLYDAPVGGSQAGPVLTRDDVVVTSGLFTAALDFGAVFGGSKRFLEVGVRPGASTGAYTILSPRQELTPAPYAVFSGMAPWTGLSGKPAGFADDTDNDVLGGLSCASGQVAKWNGAAWTCAADADSGGDITAVTAGTGLSGGATSGAATLSVNPAAVQSRVSGTCAAGSAVQAVNQNGTVNCQSVPTPPVAWSFNGNTLTVETTSTNSVNYAIRATSVSPNGTAIDARTTGGYSGSAITALNSALSGSGTNSGQAIYAENSGPNGVGITVEQTATTGSATGLVSRAHTGTGTAFMLSGYSSGDGSGGQGTNSLVGVRGEVWSQNAHGVEGRGYGIRTTKSSALAGVYGQTNSTMGYGVYSNGDMGTSGAKAFVNPHPTDPARAIQFFTLEGNESGTYFRGSGRLDKGKAELEIPEEWRLVTEASSITVQLTPIGAPALLYVVEKGRERIVVGGTADVAFDYQVNGVRRGFARYEPYLTSDAFRPEQRGVPFGGQWPQELRDILVQNGILNADYTPNEATASRLGWELLGADEMPQEGAAPRGQGGLPRGAGQP